LSIHIIPSPLDIQKSSRVGCVLVFVLCCLCCVLLWGVRGKIFFDRRSARAVA
jgi:hypothetical protein